MTTEEIRATLLRCLVEVAPDIVGEDLEDDDDLREEYDLDSMDILRWVQGIHKAIGVEIPEEDYAQIATLAQAVAYVAPRTSEK